MMATRALQALKIDGDTHTHRHTDTDTHTHTRMSELMLLPVGADLLDRPEMQLKVTE